MKNQLQCFSAFLTFLCLSGMIYAQAPNAIPYQGVARDAVGNILSSQPISLRMSIHDVSASGTVIFSETHAVITTTLGLFNVNIGTGSALVGTLAGVNWGNSAKFMQVEMDATGGVNYIDMGTTQLMSVPYAMYAEKANVPGLPGPQGLTGPQGPPGLLISGSFAGNTPYWDGTSWVTNSSNIFNNGSNVGIGTTTPVSEFTVVDSSTGTEGAIVSLLSPNLPSGGLTSITFGKNTTSTGNQAEMRYEYYGNLDNKNGYAFGFNNILPFVRFTRNQRVSIGGNSTPGGQLELSLDQGRKPGTNTWTITSDKRLKTIDGAYTKGLADIMKLNPIAYHYKNMGKRTFEKSVIETQYVGFTAQDVQRIFPEAVGEDDDGYLNLNIHSILIAEVNAIKELQAQIDEQKKKLETQNTLVNELRNRIEALEKKNK